MKNRYFEIQYARQERDEEVKDYLRQIQALATKAMLDLDCDIDYEAEQLNAWGKELSQQYPGLA